MSRKRTVLDTLVEYFVKKGKILTRHEYCNEPDIPVHPATVKRVISNWIRLEKIIQNSYPEEYAKIIAGPVVEKPEVAVPKTTVKKVVKPVITEPKEDVNE